MEIIDLIISEEKIKKACFLCLELNSENKIIYEDLVIKGQKFNLKTSLFNIIKDMLPAVDILFGQACDSCTNTITKMYYLLKEHLFKKDLIEGIISCISKGISRKDLQTSITINLPINVNKSDTGDEIEEIINKDGQVNHIKQLRSEFSVKTDKNVYTNSDSIVCHICGKTCMKPKALKAHLNCHFKKQCPYCNRLLKSHSHFTKHVNNHFQRHKKTKKLYNCPICAYSSHTKADLDAHRNKEHLKIKPYKCHKCLKCFYRKRNLTAHELIHDDLRMIICEVCGQSFVNKRTLTVHLRLHDERKIYKCDTCHRYFTTQSRRNEHMKRNHSNKFLSCLFCERKYTLKKELNNHMKRFHLNVQSL